MKNGWILILDNQGFERARVVHFKDKKVYHSSLPAVILINNSILFEQGERYWFLKWGKEWTHHLDGNKLK